MIDEQKAVLPGERMMPELLWIRSMTGGYKDHHLERMFDRLDQLDADIDFAFAKVEKAIDIWKKGCCECGEQTDLTHMCPKCKTYLCGTCAPMERYQCLACAPKLERIAE